MEKAKNIIMNKKFTKIILWTAGALAAAALGVVAYFGISSNITSSNVKDVSFSIPLEQTIIG